MNKILVCGGRKYEQADYLFQVLDYIHSNVSISCVINGAARGADSLSSDWARVNDIDYTEYPADWDHYGNSAGYIRNQKMVDEEEIDFAIVFPGGSGTQDMCRRLEFNGIPFYRVSGKSDKRKLDKFLDRFKKC